MPNEMPDEFREAAYPQETGQAFILLIEIDHEDIEAPIYLTDAGGTYDPELDTNTLVVGAITYVCAPIDVTPPGQTDDEPNGTISIPNVDRQIGRAINSISTAAVVTITAVPESDPTVIVGGPHELLKLQAVEGNAMNVRGQLLRPELSRESYPMDTIRPGKFTAAYRI